MHAMFLRSPGDDPFASWSADGEHAEALDRYAHLLVVHALGLRPGQRLFIDGELIHRPFALRVGEAAYAAGAGHVAYRLTDPQATAQLIRHGRPDQIALHAVEQESRLNDVLRAGGALLNLVGKGDPLLASELRRAHPRNQKLFSSESSALSVAFTRRVFDQRLCPMTVAVCPTPAWARQVFPGLPENEAFERLWQAVLSFVHAERPDALDLAAAEARRLASRCALLDDLAPRELHVHGGGNDLRIRLGERSRWRHGEGVTTSGQRFAPNVPSFEVFTTPDRRGTEGRLVISRPISLLGGRVEGLVLEFAAGKLVRVEAERGAELLHPWLDVDEGARYLGEVALVGLDSPIAASGLAFANPYLDENAAAHVALGQAYAWALEGGESLAADELEALGCNHSAIHLDLPFGGPEVDVTVRTGEEEVAVLEKGYFTPRWRGDDFAGEPV